MNPVAVLGIDSGNTKTAAVCCTPEGRMVAWHRVGSSNYQTLGTDRACEALCEAALPVARAANAEGLTVAALAIGLNGLDRDKDLAVLQPLVERVVSRIADVVPVAAEAPRVLRNDAFLVLRAGTDDGIGIAVSSGSGGNCVGVARDGRRLQVGGLTAELGDGGGAGHIALAALNAAGLARDGRGWHTSFSDKVVALLGLSSIEDIADFTIPGQRPGDAAADGPPQVGLLAPLVFQSAAEGDLVCRRILADLGRDLGRAAQIAAFRLGFAPDDPVPLILGGSVLMHAQDPTFAQAIVLEMQTRFPNAVPHTLVHHPVLGSLLLALDELAAHGDRALADRLADGSLRTVLGPRVTGLF
jgi:N-acetylglucosamine kinase-like BadF-type ATPase